LISDFAQRPEEMEAEATVVLIEKEVDAHLACTKDPQEMTIFRLMSQGSTSRA